MSKQLNSPNKTIIKNAVKRIIESFLSSKIFLNKRTKMDKIIKISLFKGMSLGDDMAELFPDVIKSLTTNDLELKVFIIFNK